MEHELNKPIKLWDIYKKVTQRSRVGRTSNYLLPYAKKSAEYAKKIFDNEKPTLTKINAFREVEKEWLMRSTRSTKCLADEFEMAIRSKNWIIGKPNLNTYELGFNPDEGFVYLLTCSEMPGCIKVGCIKSNTKLQERIENYKSRYQLKNVRIIYKIKTHLPSKIEHEVHKILAFDRISGPNNNKSNEWFKVTKKKALAAIDKSLNK